MAADRPVGLQQHEANSGREARAQPALVDGRILDASGREIQLDSRPSDAIALAIRAKAPVLVEDRVFDKSDILPGAPSAPRI